MKKQFFSTLCGLLATLLVSSAYAQENGIKTLPDVTVTSPASVSTKVSDAFNTSFKDAVSTTWYRLNKDYLVEFITGDMNNKALYRKNGALIYHISYGHEKNLPAEIRRLVKSNYVDYNISNAINVQQDNRNIWVVNLEDNKKLIIARVEDGALEEVSNLQKSL